MEVFLMNGIGEFGIILLEKLTSKMEEVDAQKI
jgi:hypothetical protein